MPDKKTPQSSHRQAIDWADINRRLEHLRLAIEGDWRPQPERVQEILRERARALALPTHVESAPQQQLELLEFSLAREHYGIASACVREVYPLTDFTSVPCTPPFVLGIVNVRGEIVSVIDIRKFFGLPTSGITDLNKVIIIHNDAMLFGIVVDSILDVRHIAVADLLPAANISGMRASYLLGVTPERMAVIDVEKLLGDKKIVVDEEVII
ncbi:MAG TPA: chemotaxis protein CheW [Spongiibacteraceae bacterium]|jgi:purine-binding chemotaxis protein CheW